MKSFTIMSLKAFCCFLDNFDHHLFDADGLGMLICQAIESFNIWTSAGLSTSSIYGEVLNKLESRND